MNYTKQNNKKSKNKHKSKNKKLQNSVGSIAIRVLASLFLVAMFATTSAVIGAYVSIIQNAPKLEAPSIMPNIYTTIIYNSRGEEIDRLQGEENREYIKFNNIPQQLKDAIIAIEDERFYEHDGIDLKGMVRAVWTNLTTSRKEGASTITQQLIKNIVTKKNKNTITSKLQEQVLAVQFEKELTATMGEKRAAKDYILEVYMNTIAMHHNLNGVQTAARYYFDKSVNELTLSECAVLAAITNWPSLYAPDVNPEKNNYRKELVLDKMLERGFITEAEYDDAIEDDVYSRLSASSSIEDQGPSYHDYFVDQLIQNVADDLMKKYPLLTRSQAIDMVYNAGLQIISTQDLKIQGVLDEVMLDESYFAKAGVETAIEFVMEYKNIVTEQTKRCNEKGTLKSPDEADDFVEKVKDKYLGANDVIINENVMLTPQPQAAMIIIDYHTGHVLAMAGGRGEKQTNWAFNRATKAVRQPGSVFKILASYAPALDMGLITPSTIIADEQYIYFDGYKDYEPNNWWNTKTSKIYKGVQTVRSGIRESMNILAVKNLIHTGINNCYDYLISFGFKSLVDADRGASLALGGITNGVSQIELAAAYGAIANGGEYIKPILYTKVLDHDGKEILTNVPESKYVMKKTTSFLLIDMMKDVVNATGGTGGSVRFSNVKMPVAGKTGTTSEDVDLVFTGFTPYYVASVWVGFDIQKKIPNSGEKYHLKIWKAVMEKIHEGLDYKDFEIPDGIVKERICIVSGKLAISGICDTEEAGNQIRYEYYASGTQPRESCDAHASVKIDLSNNCIATDNCPPAITKSKIVTKSWVSDGLMGITWVLDIPICTTHSAAAQPVQPTQPVQPADTETNNPDDLSTEPDESLDAGPTVDYFTDPSIETGNGNNFDNPDNNIDNGDIIGRTEGLNEQNMSQTRNAQSSEHVYEVPEYNNINKNNNSITAGEGVNATSDSGSLSYDDPVSLDSFNYR